MLISEALNAAMNTQIGSEFSAANQYLQVAAHFHRENLPQLAAFFFSQADEERMHGMKFVHYILDAGGKVMVPAVSQPSQAVITPEQAAKTSIEWEEKVTDQITELNKQAAADNDFAALEFLSWFATEQLEEVNTMTELLQTIQRAGDQILLVEDYLARRGAPAA